MHKIHLQRDDGKKEIPFENHIRTLSVFSNRLSNQCHIDPKDIRIWLSVNELKICRVYHLEWIFYEENSIIIDQTRTELNRTE